MIDFFKEREFGDVFRDTFVFFKQEIKPIISILLIFVAPFSLYGVYFMFKYQNVMQDELLKSFKSQDFSNIPNSLYIFIAFSILQQILTILSISSYIKLRIKQNEETVISISDIFNEVGRFFLNVFSGQMFVFTVIFAAFFISAMIGIISYSIFFLIIWTVYVLVSMYLLSFIIIFEEISLLQAIKRSLELIKGNWWFTFGSIIVFGIIVGLSEMTISSIITSIIGIVSKGDFAAIIVLLVSAFVSVVLSAISVIVPAYLYASFVTKITR